MSELDKLIAAVEAGKLLDDLRKPWMIAENMQPLLLQAADALEALHAQIAVAKAAQTMVVERAAATAYRVCAETRHVTLGRQAEDAIRALADTDGLALVQALRAERDGALAANRGLVRLNERTEADRDRLRADAQAAHEGGMDAAADKILDWLAKAVGAKEYTACDGSETWDGDVQGTIYAILKAGNVYDDEDGRVAKLADAQAAVALVVERAVRGVSDLTHWTGDDDHGTTLVALQEAITAIRALASRSGVDALAALRAERDAALAEVARFREDRTYVIGATDGWDTAVEQGEASPAVGNAMVRFWKRLAETHNSRAEIAEADRERLVAANAALEAEIAITDKLMKAEAEAYLELYADRDRLAAANAALEAQVARLVGMVKVAGRARLIIDTSFLEMGETVNYAPSVITEVCDMLEPHSALAEVQADARREGGE